MLAEMVHYVADRFELEHRLARELADDNEISVSGHETIVNLLSGNSVRGAQNNTSATSAEPCFSPLRSAP
jgi:hypothetical protein